MFISYNPVLCAECNYLEFYIMKVSFDFDGTLSRTDVQEFAKTLIKDGLDVWIFTCRLCPKKAPNNEWNDDLFKVVNELGISKSKIIFTNYEYKAKYLDDTFIWHLDDDWIELNEINRQRKTVGVSVFGNSVWKQKCLKILNRT